MVAWESFGEGWVTDVVKQLKLDATVKTPPSTARSSIFRPSISTRDVVFTWNGTTSRRARAERRCIPADRAGLTICDATSAAFAQDLPWDKLDVVTFSWQKVLGGEAAHGMLILSPRAVERLESYTPAWPLPKIFRLTKGGKLIEGIFVGETINTPSMLASRITSTRSTWAKNLGGLPGLIARADANAQAVTDSCDNDWIDNLAEGPGDALQHLGLPEVHRRRIRMAPPSPRRWPSGSRPRAWRSTSAPTAMRPGSADLVRRHGRDLGHRGADAVARLGLRRDRKGRGRLKQAA
jgi:phosphoserine aminotransferase